MESIAKGVRDTMWIAKGTGGIGIGVTKLRAAGSPVKTTNTESTGPIPFIKMLDTALFAVSGCTGLILGGGKQHASPLIAQGFGDLRHAGDDGAGQATPPRRAARHRPQRGGPGWRRAHHSNRAPAGAGDGRRREAPRAQRGGSHRAAFRRSGRVRHGARARALRGRVRGDSPEPVSDGGMGGVKPFPILLLAVPGVLGTLLERAQATSDSVCRLPLGGGGKLPPR